MTIDRNEWSNYPLLQPKENNIPEITLYWKHSTVRREGGCEIAIHKAENFIIFNTNLHTLCIH